MPPRTQVVRPKLEVEGRIFDRPAPRCRQCEGAADAGPPGQAPGVDFDPGPLGLEIVPAGVKRVVNPGRQQVGGGIAGIAVETQPAGPDFPVGQVQEGVQVPEGEVVQGESLSRDREIPGEMVDGAAQVEGGLQGARHRHRPPQQGIEGFDPNGSGRSGRQAQPGFAVAESEVAAGLEPAVGGKQQVVLERQGPVPVDGVRLRPHPLHARDRERRGVESDFELRVVEPPCPPDVDVQVTGQVDTGRGPRTTQKAPELPQGVVDIGRLPPEAPLEGAEGVQ